MRFWSQDDARLRAAKAFQKARLAWIEHQWFAHGAFRECGFVPDAHKLRTLLTASASMVVTASDATGLLTEEARLTKELFKTRKI